MTPPPELPRPVRLDSLGEGIRDMTIEADVGERLALAARFDLIAIGLLTATVRLTRQGDAIDAAGQIRARVVQRCVATGQGVPAKVDEDFALRFVAEGTPDPNAEVELSEADLDVVEYQGSAIDLGEAVAETLALLLDPFPRAADADAVLRAAGVRTESEAAAEASPFAALKGLVK